MVFGFIAIGIAVIGIVVMTWDSICYVLSDKHVYEDYIEDIKKEEEKNDV